MASRNFSRKQSLEKEIKELYAQVSIGADGAATVQKALGIESVVRTAQGVYRIILQDKYTRLMNINVTQLVASAQDLNFQLMTATPSTDRIVRFRALTGVTATDPTSGSILFIKLDLKNTSVSE